ncbi:hypothetical protein Trydic_g14163 [Trypoxylus dichotomus]
MLVVMLDCKLNKVRHGSIFIYQSNYIKQVVQRFNLKDASSLTIPADPHVSLQAVQNDIIANAIVPYREAVGSLMYIAIVSRPDIMIAVDLVSPYMKKHCTHWNAVKRIIRYLKGSSDFGVLYKSGDNIQPLLIGYSDADFANDVDTRRSASGYTFKMQGGAVTWYTQRQSCVCLSTTEAEYVALSHCAKEVSWLQNLLSDINDYVVKPTPICVDNQSAIRLVNNQVYHKRTKHIDSKRKIEGR